MAPDFSIVVPVFNEADAVETLAREIAAAFDGSAYEMIFVDDASTDATRERLVGLKPSLPALRVIGHGKNAGQSRALRTGLLAAQGAIVVTMDGDGQNDPADAPRLARRLLAAQPGVGLIGGERVRRRDTLAKRVASRIGNAVRRRMLNDGAADTGCGLKALRREVFLRLPYFDHMHRFLPALVLREGFETAFEPVGHRPRQTGASKYTNLARLKASMWDMLGLLWLNARARPPGDCREI